MTTPADNNLKTRYSPYTPDRLRDDALVEAICEFRFECHEVTEIVIGRLSDNADWGSFTVERLPSSSIPSAIRENDPNLRFEPTLQLRSDDGRYLVKIGGRVISLHNVQGYCGWDQFQPKLNALIDFIFGRLAELSITRIGFRYVNGLTPERHKISALAELNLSLVVTDNPLDGPINLNYGSTYSDTHRAMTRIASKEFVQGALPEGTIVVIDVDITTPKDLTFSEPDQVKQWVNDAHDFEKDAFFRLIPPEISQELEAK